MLKKTMTYTDYDNNQRTEDFYFNLSKGECMEMNLSTTGGLEQLICKLISTQDMPKLAELFKTIILKAYGEKSADGKRFIKSPELSEAFSQTEAFSDLYVELSTNADEAAKFINAIITNNPNTPVNNGPALVPPVNNI